MQEIGPRWDPMYLDHSMSWEMKFFALYVLFALVFFFVRGTQLAWFVWQSRKTHSRLSLSEPLHARTMVMRDLALASGKAVSLKRCTVLTMFLSLAVSATQAVDFLNFAAMQKMFVPAAIAASASRTLSVLAFGLNVCALLYATFAIFEGKLSRLRIRLEHGQLSNPQ